MSKLATAVAAHPTGTRRALPAAGLTASFVEDRTARIGPTFVNGTEYRIGVTLESRTIVSDRAQAVGQIDVLKAVIDETRRSVIEAVFGEFRPHFRRLHHALWNRDFDTARELLHQFESQMFSTDSAATEPATRV